MTARTPALVATTGSQLYGCALPTSDRNTHGVWRLSPDEVEAGTVAPGQSEMVAVRPRTFARDSRKAAADDNGASHAMRDASAWLRLVAAADPGATELAYVRPPHLQWCDDQGAALRLAGRQLLTLRLGGCALSECAASVDHLTPAVRSQGMPVALWSKAAGDVLRRLQHATVLLATGDLNPSDQPAIRDNMLRMRRSRLSFDAFLALYDAARDALASVIAVNPQGLREAATQQDADAALRGACAVIEQSPG